MGSKTKAFIVFSFLLGCNSNKATQRELQMDSVVNEIKDYTLLAYHEVQEEYPPIEEVYPKLDTIFLTRAAEVSVDTSFNEFHKIDSGNILVVDECIDLICRLSAYKTDGSYVTYGYLPQMATARLKNPDMDMERLTMYNTHRNLLKRYHWQIMNKYHLTVDEFDSIYYNIVRDIRNKRY